MKKAGAVFVAAVVLCAALFLGGCTDLIGNNASKDGYSMTGQYITIAEPSIAGWVEVATSAGGVIHWGDSFDDASYITAKGPGTYGHYFRHEGVYAVRLIQNDAYIVDIAIAEVRHSGGHIELARTEGSTIVVTVYGAEREFYWIVWGDSNMTTVPDNYGHSTGLEWSHTYSAPGTYEIGIRGDVDGGDAYRACFEVTVH